jgi:thymidine kinase
MKIGKLELIMGNMFSGKSTELIRRFNREKTLHSRIILVNYYLDSRYSSESKISTHDKTQVECLKIEKLEYLLNVEILNKYDSFFIDEGQFFTDLYPVVKKLIDEYNKHVIVAGLDGDFNRNKFGDIISLIPLSDTLDKLSAYCNMCNDGTYGPFTKKISNNSSELIEIGGKDLYLPVCRYHYHLN